MNMGGEAADQIVKMSLNGVEVAAKITGAGAKQLAILLYTILKDQNKTRGKARLVSMLRSDNELKVFSIKNSDMKEFSQRAKDYGVLYCALRNRRGNPDGMVDVMVREKDAVKINRIVERFKFATVDTASVKVDIEKTRAEKAANKEKTPAVPEKSTPDKAAEDKLLDELFEQPVKKEGVQQANPSAAKTEKSHPSEPTSKKPGRSAEGTTKPPNKTAYDRPSVRQELKEIKAAQKKKADMPKRDEPQKDSRPKQAKSTRHQQPQPVRKKSTKPKER